MIAWLAPLGGLAALAALPVAVHLLSRRIRTERPFPAVALLRRAAGGRARIGVLRQRLALAVRILAVAAALAAAAAPVLRAGGSAAGAPAVIIVDGSASMHQGGGGTSAFTRAVGAAGRLLDALGTRPVLVLIAGAPPERSGSVPDIDRGAARALLAAAAPGWAAGTLDGAIATSLESLGGAGDLYAITDGSRGALAGVDPGSFPAGIAWHHVVVDGGGTNRAITALAVEPGTLLAGRPATLRARVMNYGPAAQLTVQLTVDGQTTSHALALAAQAGTVVEERFTPAAPGDVRFAAAIIAGNEGDTLAEDDRRVGAAPVEAAIPLRLYGDGDPQAGDGPLRPLLMAARAAGLAAVVRPGRDLPRDLAAGDPRPLIVSAGLAVAGADLANALLDHLRRGGTWLQVVATDADAGATAAGIDPPARIGAAVDLSSRVRGLAVGRLALGNPLCAGLDGREPLLARLEAWRFRPAPPLAGATVAIAFEDGSSLLALRPVGPGWWVQLNLSPADADSNLAALEILPLLIPHLPEVGGPGRLADAADPCGTGRPAAAATDPDGVPAILREGAVRLVRPGLWLVDGRPRAAGIPAAEADLRQVEATGDAPTAQRSDAAGAVAAARDRPLWAWALLACLLLLAAELALAGGLPSRRAGRGP